MLLQGKREDPSVGDQIANELGLRCWLEAYKKFAQRHAHTGRYEAPRFDAAMSVDAPFQDAWIEQFIDVNKLWSFALPVNDDRPLPHNATFRGSSRSYSFFTTR
jgi:hypothetical protein